MQIGSSITNFSTSRPKTVTLIMLILTVSLGLLAALPSIWPSTFKSLNPLIVDTDPENMLPHDEAVRIFHRDMKKEMSLYDIIVLGVVNENHKLSLFGYYSPSDDDSYLRPSIHYKVTDYWSAEAGGNVFLGAHKHTFFGQFENNNNIYTAIRYSF